jgi:hypothetical protein
MYEEDNVVGENSYEENIESMTTTDNECETIISYFSFSKIYNFKNIISTALFFSLTVQQIHRISEKNDGSFSL